MLELIEGWTKPINEQILSNGSPYDLAGLTVSLRVYPKGGRTFKSLSGTVTVIDAVNGKVQFTPASGDLLSIESPYAVRWAIVNGGVTYFAPQGAPEEWVVRRP